MTVTWKPHHAASFLEGLAEPTEWSARVGLFRLTVIRDDTASYNYTVQCYGVFSERFSFENPTQAMHFCEVHFSDKLKEALELL